MPSTNDKPTPETSGPSAATVAIGEWEILTERECGEWVAQMVDNESMFFWAKTKGSAIIGLRKGLMESAGDLMEKKKKKKKKKRQMTQRWWLHFFGTATVLLLAVSFYLWCRGL